MEHYTQEQLHTIAALKRIQRAAPDAAYMRSARSALLTRIAHEERFVQTRHAPVFVAWAVRMGIAVVSIALVGVGASFASQYILPNSFLYPIKLAAERAQINLAGDGDASKVALRSKFAETRIVEIRTLESGNGLDDQALQASMQEYIGTIASIQRDVARIAQNDTPASFSDLLASEQKIDALDRQIGDIVTQLEGKAFSDAAIGRARDAVASSYQMRFDIKRNILAYEANHQTLENDGAAVARLAFLVDAQQRMFDAVSDVLTQKIQADAQQRMQEQSIINPNVAPEKLAITLPKEDVELQQMASGIQEELALLRGRLSEPGARFNESEVLGFSGRVAEGFANIDVVSAALARPLPTPNL